jgi:phage virion morphogenesis protein
MDYPAGGRVTDDMNALEHWAGALLMKLQPAQRRAVNQKVATDLRRSQMRRIADQKAPDGETYAARKKRKDLRAKSGRIKRQKAMFTNLRKAKYLKIRSDESQTSIGYFGWIARVARIHQEGLAGRVVKDGALHRYAMRQLLGFSKADHTLIRESLLHHVTAI